VQLFDYVVNHAVQSLFQGYATQAIVGFTLAKANYGRVIELLLNRFAMTSRIG